MEIDVIIPVFNQSKPLYHVLIGFCNQLTDHHYSVYVVDDGSTEAIQSIITDEIRNKLSINYISQQVNKGRAKARNDGSKAGKSELIIFNDCDRIPCASFIENHAQSFIGNGHEKIVIGIPKEIYAQKDEAIWNIINEKNHLARHTRFTSNVLSLYGSNGETDSYIPWISTFSGNMSIKRDVFEKYMFDEHFTAWGFENIELGYRMYKDGIRFSCNHYAINYHMAHKRSANSYTNGIEWSINYMQEKYDMRSEISMLKEFILGNASLQDFERQVGNAEASWLMNHNIPIMNKLS